MMNEEDDLTRRFNALLKQQHGPSLSAQPADELPFVFRRSENQTDIPVLTDAVYPEGYLDQIVIDPPQPEAPPQPFFREQALRSSGFRYPYRTKADQDLSEPVRQLLNELLPVMQTHLARSLEKACEKALLDFRDEVERITQECSADLIQ
ncbi:MAG: hypothetical protein KGL58_01040, partial [Pseudomonadota bacterium]|nr:hypothetical protein [Pseudomonadota bacterium]